MANIADNPFPTNATAKKVVEAISVPKMFRPTREDHGLLADEALRKLGMTAQHVPIQTAAEERLRESESVLVNRSIALAQRRTVLSFAQSVLQFLEPEFVESREASDRSVHSLQLSGARRRRRLYTLGGHRQVPTTNFSASA
jgi:hypothetical protein